MMANKEKKVDEDIQDFHNAAGIIILLTLATPILISLLYILSVCIGVN